MDEAGTLPTSLPPRRWSLGADSPVADMLPELAEPLAAQLKLCTQSAADALPADYGDPGGLWVTVRRQNPFDVLLLDDRSAPPPDLVLVRFRVLWKFWTQKLAVSRQGATRTAIRQKYGDQIESYVDNLQWAYDQLTSEGGIAFWRNRVDEERSQKLWKRIGDSVEATLSDGMLDPTEISHLMSRAEYAGYEREEFARVLRDLLHTRRFEPELAPSGDTESARLASVRWATADVWKRNRTTKTPRREATAELFYVRTHVAGVVIGPVTAHAVTGLIRQNRVGARDDVCVVGESQWAPLLRTKFAPSVPGYGTSVFPCPSCAAPLIAVGSSVTLGWVLLILGLLSAPILVGIPLAILGAVMVWGKGKKAGWRCARCGYAT